jgi:hypothetical protein
MVPVLPPPNLTPFHESDSPSMAVFSIVGFESQTCMAAAVLLFPP